MASRQSQVMRKTLRILCSAALLTLGAFTSVAAPIPLSAVGIGKSISITGHPYNILGGGGFSAIVDGFATTVWCVDSQNTISVGDMYIANVILLGNWPSGQNALVRKGTNTNWSDGLSLTALQRYQASAYLIEQYSGFPDGPDADTTANRRIQNAIWRITHQKGGGGAFPASNTPYADAVSFITNPLNVDFGKGKWAVISGSVNRDGEFTKPTYQTFMVQVAGPEVPEPATYGLMGAALCALAFIRRRAMQN
jgi:hypothetical protein